MIKCNFEAIGVSTVLGHSPRVSCLLQSTGLKFDLFYLWDISDNTHLLEKQTILLKSSETKFFTQNGPKSPKNILSCFYLRFEAIIMHNFFQIIICTPLKTVRVIFSNSIFFFRRAKKLYFVWAICTNPASLLLKHNFQRFNFG